MNQLISRTYVESNLTDAVAVLENKIATTIPDYQNCEKPAENTHKDTSNHSWNNHV